MNAESPRVVGRYVVHAEIAAGGMATVHVGRLLGPVGFARTVAIKRLHPQFAKNPEFVTMFLDEARLAARVRHPNVVPVLDVVAEGGELFLVMDYVEGESLSRLISASRKRGHAPPSRIAAAIVAQSLHGLHAAHEARDERGDPLSIVHRDMSPQNVLVGTDGVARVLDFGVAKAIGRASITREGELKGKLPYMAPEQVRRRGEVTRRTDIYSAGVVLWEALCARRLFDGDGEGEILSAVLDGATDLPSSEEPSVPAELDAITMRALRKDPSERFATAREMAVAIERVIGLVTPAEIGAWASELGAESLAARAHAVAEIESSPGIATAYATPLLEETATMPVVIPPDPMDDIDNMITVPRAPLREPMDEIDNMVTVPRAPLRAKVIVAPEPRPPPPPRRGLWLWLALAMLAVFCASFVAVFALSRRPVEEEVVPPRPRAAVPKTTPSAEPSVTAPPQELAPIAFPSVSVKKPQPIYKPPPPPPPTTTVAKPNCSPPYYYENGIKHFKPNCL
jgi:serine/threonine-protein kinase